MKNKTTYKNTYKNKNHFSFGENWKDFLSTLNNERINQAKKSLINFLGGTKNIKGKSFVDIGCGSGLFSLAAYLLGASKIVSVDIDDSSIWCANSLKEKYANKNNWSVIKGSALDINFLKSLGKFDIVYSWGVLHHTGNMYQAIINVSKIVKPGKIFYLAIYNESTSFWQGGSSKFWLKIKKLYNSSTKFQKSLILKIYMTYQIASLILISRTNPISFIRNYKKKRGMSWKHDLIDWLGGYPYEFALSDELINFMGNDKFLCKKMKFRNGTGCNEFIFKNLNKK